MSAIRHHIPGRLRVSLKKKDRFLEFREWVLEQPDLQLGKANVRTLSIVILYDSKELKRSGKGIESRVRKVISRRNKNGGDLVAEGENTIFDSSTSLSPVLFSGTGLLFSLLLPPPWKMIISMVISLPVLLSGGKEFLAKGVTSHFMEALAVAISLVRRNHLAANITSFLLSTGEYMEESLSKKSDSMLMSLLHKEIEWVWVEREGQPVKVDFAEVRQGDTIVVHAGETVPVDGVVLDGQASVNQASMTGESIPVRKERGDRLLSGTVLMEGRVKFFAERVGESTAVSRISRYIESALENRSETEAEAARMADQLVPVTLVLSGLSYAFNRKPAAVTSVLQADYSCALKLSTPVAFKSAIYRLGSNGVVVKDGRALENLARVDTFIFDKTGTLTEGRLLVERVIVSPGAGMTSEELLNMVASVEEHYFHPIAEAIVLAAREKKFKHFHHSDVEYIAGHGVYSTVGNRRVILGSAHYLKDHEGISFDAMQDELKKHSAGRTLLYIGMEQEPLGVIVLKDSVRKEAKDTIADLRALGVKEMILLSGDDSTRAKKMGRELGLDRAYGDLVPEDKARIVQELKEKGRTVAFVGDGINDGPALATVALGISMGTGADISIAVSDIVLLRDDIRALAHARKIAMQTMSLIRSNYGITTAVNSGIILGAATGAIAPSLSALLHNGSTVGVILRSLQGVSWPKEKEVRSAKSEEMSEETGT